MSQLTTVLSDFMFSSPALKMVAYSLTLEFAVYKTNISKDQNIQGRDSIDNNITILLLMMVLRRERH